MVCGSVGTTIRKLWMIGMQLPEKYKENFDVAHMTVALLKRKS
jgi:hypothetical protein